ncbi:hypothetical protein DPEC_G00182790 [Dallia pectoralis]|uniref:Uncharacterized protein n=1 Tax=Dallia pectoralis TaxID=75939 RepID=A0ACC2GAV3_DALPE|nr:hypothetical protein DPEC_G00182790 [Dallia pectoralis]
MNLAVLPGERKIPLAVQSHSSHFLVLGGSSRLAAFEQCVFHTGLRPSSLSDVFVRPCSRALNPVSSSVLNVIPDERVAFGREQTLTTRANARSFQRVNVRELVKVWSFRSVWGCGWGGGGGSPVDEVIRALLSSFRMMLQETHDATGLSCRTFATSPLGTPCSPCFDLRHRALRNPGSRLTDPPVEF